MAPKGDVLKDRLHYLLTAGCSCNEANNSVTSVVVKKVSLRLHSTFFSFDAHCQRVGFNEGLVSSLLAPA